MTSVYNHDIAVWEEEDVSTNCSSCLYPLDAAFVIRIGAIIGDRRLCPSCFLELYEQIKSFTADGKKGE